MTKNYKDEIRNKKGKKKLNFHGTKHQLGIKSNAKQPLKQNGMTLWCLFQRTLKPSLSSVHLSGFSKAINLSPL